MEFVKISNEQREQIKSVELMILDELDRICTKYDIHYMISYGSLIGAIRHKGYIPWDDDLDLCMLRKDYIKFKEVCKKELDSKFFYQSHDTDPEYYYLFDKIRMNNTIFKESFVSKYNIHHGIYIDIFPIDYLPQNIIDQNIQFIKFHFYRTGVMTKYLMLEARTGKKKYIFSILKLLYSFFSLEYLYNGAHKEACKYNDKKCLKATNFFSPYHRKDTFDIDFYTNLTKHIFENRYVWIPQRYKEYLTKIYGDYMKLPPLEERNTRHTVVELKL